MPDAGALAVIHAACFTTPRPWTAAEIAALLDSPHVFVVAESGGFIMGRAIAGEAEVLTVAVLPDHRRQGMGARLVLAFLAESKLREAKTAFLEVAARNSAAICLYKQTGFVESGRRKGYYHGPNGEKDDALILSRAI